MDTWTTAKLVDMEMAIIKEEQKEANKYKDKKVYEERPDGNSEEMNNLMDEMTIE